MAKSEKSGKRADPMQLKTKDPRSFPEIISFPGGKEIVVQRPSSPAEMGVGDVGAIEWTPPNTCTITGSGPMDRRR